MNQQTLTAREAFDDCLTIFESTLRPAMKADSGGFEGDITPGDGFEISLTITHGALTALVKRYPAANFTFHSERNERPGLSDMRSINPLRDLYTELTIDFTPYGTIFGGSSDDNGGGMTRGSNKEGEGEIEPDGVGTTTSPSGPTGPSGPSLANESSPSPAAV